MFTRGQRVASLVCGVLVVGLFAGVIHAQTPISVRELVRGFYSRYKNEQVAVQGWVSAEKRVSSTTFKAYYLKDRYGSTIVVRTVNKLPEINSEVLVTGVALVDADSKRFFISETKRKLIRSAPGEQPEAEEGAWKQLPELPSTENLILIGFIAVGLLWVVLRLRRRKAAPTAYSPAPPPGPSPSYKPAPAPAPEPVGPYKPTPPPIPSTASAPVASSSVDDFKTVRVYKTTKVLPGTLVVLENGQETDTIYLSDQSGRDEIEIGRDNPDIAGGIRIKDKTNTLSRRQARILYSASDKQFKLVNLAGEASNPTMINGRQMSGDETVVLNDNDVLRMGNVELKFKKP